MLSNFNLSEWIIEKVSLWLLHESPANRSHLSNFERVCEILRPADIILLEGRSRASAIIKQVSQSPWSHAALYIGRLDDIKDPKFRGIVERLSNYPKETQLLIESEIGLGTLISPISDIN